eukprot:2755331-Prymnesium_polylepis.1
MLERVIKHEALALDPLALLVTHAQPRARWHNEAEVDAQPEVGRSAVCPQVGARQHAREEVRTTYGVGVQLEVGPFTRHHGVGVVRGKGVRPSPEPQRAPPPACAPPPRKGAPLARRSTGRPDAEAARATRRVAHHAGGSPPRVGVPLRTSGRPRPWRGRVCPEVVILSLVQPSLPIRSQLRPLDRRARSQRRAIGIDVKDTRAHAVCVACLPVCAGDQQRLCNEPEEDARRHGTLQLRLAPSAVAPTQRLRRGERADRDGVEVVGLRTPQHVDVRRELRFYHAHDRFSILLREQWQAAAERQLDVLTRQACPLRTRSGADGASCR